MTKLLVATGWGPASAKVVNLDNSNPDLTCDQLPALPFSTFTATGQLYNRKYPIMCERLYCNCLWFEDGAWKQIQSLNECRDGPASAVFPNPNNDEEDILLVTGGTNGASSALSTVESFDGKLWDQTMFADLPTTIAYHCLVKISDTMLFQIGGTIDDTFPGTTGSTYFLDIIQNKWIPGPQLNVGRNRHSCGLMNWINPGSGKEEKVSNHFKYIN
jgi:hypothetical protein